MALPDGTKLRKGDVVALHATVRYDNDDQSGLVFLDVHGSGQVAVYLANISGIVRRHYAKDERVILARYHLHPGQCGTVIAASDDGEFLWIALDNGGYATVCAHDVDPLVVTEPEPIEPPPAPEDWDNRRSEKKIPADRIVYTPAATGMSEAVLSLGDEDGEAAQ